jgi:hypothetical protein
VKIFEDPVQKAVLGVMSTINWLIVGPMYSSSTVNIGSAFFPKDFKAGTTPPTPPGGTLTNSFGSLTIDPALATAADIAIRAAMHRIFANFINVPPRG